MRRFPKPSRNCAASVPDEKRLRGYGVLSMEAVENLQFESEIYFKLQAAERKAELSSERYSSKDVLKAMKDAIGGSKVV